MRGETWQSTAESRLASPPNARDISTLLERVRGGSREAVDELFEGFRKDLLSLIRRGLGRSLRSHLESEDILQITFMRAFEHITEFRGTNRRCLHAWLARIARNAIRDEVDYVRRGRRDLRRTLPLERVTEALPAEERSQIYRLISEEEASHLARAMASLHDRQRLVILLREQEDLSFAEIGHRLGKSPDACRMLLARAIEALSRKLITLSPAPRLAGQAGHL